MNPLKKLNLSSRATADRRLSGIAKALMAHLIEYANGEDLVWWGKDRLSDALSCEPRSIQRAFKTLKALGYIERDNPHETGRGKFAVYKVLDKENGDREVSSSSIKRATGAPSFFPKRETDQYQKGRQDCHPNLLKKNINNTPSSLPLGKQAEPGLASARQVAPRTPPDARGAATAPPSSASDAVPKAARQEGDAENSERYDPTAVLIRRIKAFKISEENAASWLRGMIKAGATEQEISDLLDQSKARNDDREKLLAWGKSLLAKKHFDAMPTLQPVPRPDKTTAVIMAAADSSGAKLEPGHPLYNVLTSFGTAMAVKGKRT